MDELQDVLSRWQLDVNQVRERMYRAPTPRERERWHAVWLLARGWPTTEVALALERDLRTISSWWEEFQQNGPTGLAFEQSGGFPPPSAWRSKPS